MTKRRPPSSRNRLVAHIPATTAPRAKPLPLAPIAAGVLVVLIAVIAGFFLLHDDSGSETPPTATVAAASNGTDDAAAARSLVPEMAGPPLGVFPAGSVHTVGQDRFAIGLVDEQGLPVQQGSVDLLFFTLANNQGTLTEQLKAPFLPYGIEEQPGGGEVHDHGSEITGIFMTRPTFTQPGAWGVVAKVTLPDGTVRAGQADFTVVAEDPVVGPGDAGVASKTLTASTPEEAKKICTADLPDEMHALSLDEALKNGKPTVVLFATPLLCASRTCGPSLEAVAELHRRYGDQANFIHVEVYPERDGSKPVAAMDEWSLPSEPWLFLLDAQGKVVERYEGGIGLTETDPAVRRLSGAPSNT